MIKKHKFIVFGEEHYNPLGVVRSLGESGINPTVIAIKSRRKLLSKSKYIEKLYKVDSIQEGYELLQHVYGKNKVKSFVITADDKTTSFLDRHYEEMKDHFIFFNAGKNNRVSYYMDKNNINQLALKHGLNVLNAIPVKLGEIPDNLEYPVITKSIASTVGAWKKDVFICYSREELLSAYSKIKSPVVLLQKYIKKKNELCLDGFCANKGNLQFISIASNYNYVLADTYSSYMTIKNFQDAELNEIINNMMKEVGFEGIFSVEFLIDESDELYFCEINFRNSTWSYASTCAGMPLPTLWAEAMLINELPSNCYKTIEPNFTAMVELYDFRTRVRKNRISFINWWKEAKECNCLFYLGNKKDLKPVVSELSSMVLEKIKRKKKEE